MCWAGREQEAVVELVVASVVAGKHPRASMLSVIAAKPGQECGEWYRELTTWLSSWYKGEGEKLSHQSNY